MERRTYQEALADLELIVNRLTKRIEQLGNSVANKRRRAQLTAERDAVAAALAELVQGLVDSDIADVPPPVATFVEWLNGTLSSAGTDVPVHPHAGHREERAAAGGVGHCWVCATVGHEVAHPTRRPGEVGCTTEHDSGQSQSAAPPTVPAPPGPPAPPPPRPNVGPEFLPPIDLSRPPSGPMSD